VTPVFADAGYWIALLNARDQLHSIARAQAERHRTRQLVTTDAVLTELLAHYSGYGPLLRRRTVTFVRALFLNPRVEVVPQDSARFMGALALYEARLDKGYSLVDCMSMNVCRERGIQEVLTPDRHFHQEGFTILLTGS
jgi:predicted nucleic acid-binding protein